MRQCLKIKNDDQWNKAVVNYFNIWKAVGKSIGQTTATIENTSCAMFRGQQHCDNFIKGQDLYDFMEGCNEYVYVKKYNSTTWEVMEFKW